MRARFPVIGRTSARQRGMVLVVSMLLLVVVTLLAVAMFRSMGVGAKIAGNVREKQRALHAAESAEQYAVNWLSSNAANGTLPQPTVCNTGIVNVNLGANQILICSNIPYSPQAAGPANNYTPTTPNTFIPSIVPWTLVGTTTVVGFQFTPTGMTAGSCANGTSATPVNSSGVAGGTYACPPMFFISQVGTSGSNSTIYQIDSMGYGATAGSVAVIESTYKVGSETTALGGTGVL